MTLIDLPLVYFHLTFIDVLSIHNSIFTREVLNNSDLVIFLGCRAGSVTTEKWQYPDKKKKIIHIDIDPSVIDANYKSHISLIAEIKSTLIEMN